MCGRPSPQGEPPASVVACNGLRRCETWARILFAKNPNGPLDVARSPRCSLQSLGSVTSETCLPPTHLPGFRSSTPITRSRCFRHSERWLNAQSTRADSKPTSFPAFSLITHLCLINSSRSHKNSMYGSARISKTKSSWSTHQKKRLSTLRHH
jgi:hypothetical protein